MNTIKLKLLPLYVFSLLLIFSCSSDDGDPEPEPVVINNPDQDIDEFIWRGMNLWYLYKSSVNDLANDRFSNTQELFQFLNGFGSPEETYDGLKSKVTVTVNGEVFNEDAFSFFLDDYIEWEQFNQGISTTNGMNFRLILASQGSNDVLGYVRYVAPGSDADTKGVKRGDFFNAVNGTRLTTNTDFGAVFEPSTYSINLVTVDNGTITETGQTISLTKEVFTENPILVSKTIDYQGQKIGYLMYNRFVFDFDDELNTAFGQFKTDGITDLILDFRYNPGGAGSSAADLGSMVTGQFNGEVFFRREYNAEIQAAFEADDPESVITRFPSKLLADGTTDFNSLNLTRVYILTTEDSASASELMINALDPYIDVIQIGETTSGKFQGSITLYDSDDFSRNGANLNPDHTIALQPLVVKATNRDGVSDFVAGLFADVPFSESVLNLGVLGESDEPFLNAALEYIVNNQVPTVRTKSGFMEEDLDWYPEILSPNYGGLLLDHNGLPKSILNFQE